MRRVPLIALLGGCGFTVQLQGKPTGLPDVPDLDTMYGETGASTTSPTQEGTDTTDTTTSTGPGGTDTTTYTTTSPGGGGTTAPGSPSCVTGTAADLIGWLDVRDPSGAACAPCAGNAVFTAVLANPCPYDIPLELECASNDGGWVEEWSVSSPDGSGRSLSYGCDSTHPPTFVVPANGLLSESFPWDPALAPGSYDGLAELYTTGGHTFLAGLPFDVE